MKLIYGFREKQLQQIKKQWDTNRMIFDSNKLDKDKAIDIMKNKIDKIFLLLEM